MDSFSRVILWKLCSKSLRSRNHPVPERRICPQPNQLTTSRALDVVNASWLMSSACSAENSCGRLSPEAENFQSVLSQSSRDQPLDGSSVASHAAVRLIIENHPCVPMGGAGEGAGHGRNGFVGSHTSLP